MARKNRDLIEADLFAERPTCPILKPLNETGMEFRIDRLNAGRDLTNHLVHFERLDNESYSNMKKCSSDAIRVNNRTCWLMTRSCEICHLIASESAISINVKPGITGGLRYRLIFPNRASLTRFSTELSETGLKFRISELGDAHEQLDLTSRQKQVIAMAYHKGYFDVERNISMTELAETLGVSVRTVQEILRRGTRKIIERYISEEA
ncbi:MAG: helix-turn-helix domain-containing protein [Thermoplasmata archaeon YP2-bin.285]|uniref:Helix-turn-helix domain-containing protein n=1 Tax=Candidatus Sysuiplasma superficiale TaxID=2823368 RepID=A0A8J7YV55_9ARCH|nr:helix-turn-helix domain-containing protein [Candidatus Sysuiplasma superficiale]